MNKQYITDDLRILQNEKCDICISIITPTHRLSPERRTDALQLEKAIEEAKLQLLIKYNEDAVKPLIDAVNELYGQIDFLHNCAGIGLFVSKNVKKLIHFFFPVKEKIMIGHSFNVRDLIYESYYDIPYRVLMLSKKEARLFNARLNKTMAITDIHFPKKNEAEYEYNRPSRGSSYVGNAFVKDFEKDKSEMNEIRLKAFFRETDELLNSYLSNGSPLIVTGENKDLVCFGQVTIHKQHIACNIPGNYKTFNENKLGVLTWTAMKLFLDNQKEILVSDFKENKGPGPGVAGIVNSWKAVMEGRGYRLLVEKDYSVPGYINNNDDSQIYLQPPIQPHQVLTDAVTQLIRMVHEKNGEVIILENDALQDYQRLALITRY